MTKDIAASQYPLRHSAQSCWATGCHCHCPGDILHATLQRPGARVANIFPHPPLPPLNSPVPLSTAAELFTNTKAPRFSVCVMARSCRVSQPVSAWQCYREVGETLPAQLRRGYFCLQLLEGRESVAPVWFGRVSVICFHMEISQPSSASCCVLR